MKTGMSYDSNGSLFWASHKEYEGFLWLWLCFLEKKKPMSFPCSLLVTLRNSAIAVSQFLCLEMEKAKCLNVNNTSISTKPVSVLSGENHVRVCDWKVSSSCENELLLHSFEGSNMGCQHLCN